MKRLLGIIAVTPLALTAAVAQSSDPAWLDDLNYQIAADKKCEIMYIVRMEERTLGADRVFEARVQCADGRMFDANRIGENAAFTFKACDNQVC